MVENKIIYSIFSLKIKKEKIIKCFVITKYFHTKTQEVNIKSKKNVQVIYPNIFKLEPGRDPLISFQEMSKRIIKQDIF